MDQFHGMKESVFKRSIDVEEEEEDLSTLDIVKGLDDEFRDGAKELLLSAFKRGAKNTTKTVSSSFFMTTCFDSMEPSDSSKVFSNWSCSSSMSSKF